MKKIILYLCVGLLTVSTIVSCKKETPETPHEHEVITTLKYTLTPADSGTVVVLTFKDLDGEGGNEPIITGGTLAANTAYTGAIKLLNESETPVEDMTAEIKEEDKEHQFFFVSTITGVSVSYDDQDADGKPVGLKTKLTTGAAGNGNLKVTLKHEPNKSASGVSSGDITNAGGETDIEVTFPINVQ